MKQRLTYLLSRTPLHVTAGNVIGPLDYPTQRERHTTLPVIPGAVVRGGFASLWTTYAPADAGPEATPRLARSPDGIWLFGANDPANSAPGVLQFTEAKLLAFPVRSARAGFGWITCPLILKRFARDGGLRGMREGGLDPEILPVFNLRDDQAVLSSALLAIGDRVVLEEYTLYRARGEGGKEAAFPSKLTAVLAQIMPDDPVWGEAAQRLVLVSDSLMCFLCQCACEVTLADRDTRPVDTPAYQENVPAETLFYSVLNCFEEREEGRPKPQTKSPLEVFREKTNENGGMIQLGADAGAGLGYCAVQLREPAD
jgi:CRISPR-associated protein Cmr4